MILSRQLSPALRLIALSATVFALGAPAPAQPAKPTAKATAPKKRPKNLTPRAVKAIEAATGTPLAPATKTKITAALRAREAALQAANDQYYAEFAALTGLTVDQVRDIDKPPRGAKAANANATNANAPANAAMPAVKTPTEPKVETQTDTDELTTDDDETTVPVTPQKQ